MVFVVDFPAIYSEQAHTAVIKVIIVIKKKKKRCSECPMLLKVILAGENKSSIMVYSQSIFINIQQFRFSTEFVNICFFFFFFYIWRF